jgi:hypothetical protein
MRNSRTRWRCKAIPPQKNKKARARRAFEISDLRFKIFNRHARSMYLPVRVSILIFSPVLMNSGACTVIPVST